MKTPKKPKITLLCRLPGRELQALHHKRVGAIETALDAAIAAGFGDDRAADTARRAGEGCEVSIRLIEARATAMKTCDERNARDRWHSQHPIPGGDSEVLRRLAGTAWLRHSGPNPDGTRFDPTTEHCRQFIDNLEYITAGRIYGRIPDDPLPLFSVLLETISEFLP